MHLKAVASAQVLDASAAPASGTRDGRERVAVVSEGTAGAGCCDWADIPGSEAEGWALL